MSPKEVMDALVDEGKLGYADTQRVDNAYQRIMDLSMRDFHALVAAIKKAGETMSKV